jgi:hypothetical protein
VVRQPWSRSMAHPLAGAQTVRYFHLRSITDCHFSWWISAHPRCVLWLLRAQACSGAMACVGL